MRNIVRRHNQTMSQHAECKRCFFRFSGGHSHHAGSSSCICTSCLSRFSIPTKNEWGPQIGETVELILYQTATRLVPEPGPRRWCHAKNHPVDPPRPTGVQMMLVAGETHTEGEHSITLVHYPVANTECPVCGRRSLVMGFEPDDLCPQCNQGSLELGAVIY